MENRYFVDDRCGCVAVRDKALTLDEPGLHPDTEGVIQFWFKPKESKTCATCNHSIDIFVDGSVVREAEILAEQLNNVKTD